MKRTRMAWGGEAAWYWSEDIDKVSKAVDEINLSVWLERLSRLHCPGGALAGDLLAGQTPREAAARIVRTSRVGEPQFHKSLLSGDDAAVANAIMTTADPLIAFGRRVQAQLVSLAAVAEADRQAEAAMEEIARTRHELYGDREYPDATHTLRLAYGRADGYELDGEDIPWAASFGAFNRWLSTRPQERVALPESWRANAARLSSRVLFSFSSTLDIASGSSGSPIINRWGELVGVVAAHAATRVPPFSYDASRSRAIGLAAPGIVEVLRKIYGADELADELIRGRR